MDWRKAGKELKEERQELELTKELKEEERKEEMRSRKPCAMQCERRRVGRRSGSEGWPRQLAHWGEGGEA